ncbi:MAG: hypothetical protein GXO79_12955 [Chlorobi bacterium]|nr:hypothetical protein [Chlorobiota bacterium]
MITKGYFTKGIKEGIWKYWYSDGRLKMSSNWENGKLNGIYEQYNKAGVTINRILYKEGLKNGNCYWYLADTTIVKYFVNDIETVNNDVNSENNIFQLFFKNKNSSDTLKNK